MLGENLLNSGMFDSFRYTGTSMESDYNMLPLNLVAAGAFRIQDLNTAVSGTLDVKVQEQDGTSNSFKVDTITGEKAMATVRLAGRTMPAFGAVVMWLGGFQTGIVNDGAQVWLTGMNAGEAMRVIWDGKIKCAQSLPKPLPAAPKLIFALWGAMTSLQ